MQDRENTIYSQDKNLTEKLREKFLEYYRLVRVPKVHTCIRLSVSKELYDRIRKIAKEKGISVSAYLRHIIAINMLFHEEIMKGTFEQSQLLSALTTIGSPVIVHLHEIKEIKHKSEAKASIKIIIDQMIDDLDDLITKFESEWNASGKVWNKTLIDMSNKIRKTIEKIEKYIIKYSRYVDEDQVKRFVDLRKKYDELIKK